MTREEAIRIIRKMLACTDLSVRANLNADMVDACHLAIKALEQEPKIGHWILGGYDDYYYICDKCNYKASEYYFKPRYNFCPNCGVRIVELQESENKK